jgi:hypothetical protein
MDELQQSLGIIIGISSQNAEVSDKGSTLLSKSKNSLLVKPTELSLPRPQIIGALIREAEQAGRSSPWKNVRIANISIETESLSNAPSSTNMASTNMSVAGDGRALFDSVAKCIYETIRLKKRYNALFEHAQTLHVPPFHPLERKCDGRLYNYLSKHCYSYNPAPVQFVMEAIVSQIEATAEAESHTRETILKKEKEDLENLIAKLYAQTPSISTDTEPSHSNTQRPHFW